MSTSSGYVLASYELEKLEFWWWYAWAVRAHWKYPFRQGLRSYRYHGLPRAEMWPIDL